MAKQGTGPAALAREAARLLAEPGGSIAPAQAFVCASVRAAAAALTDSKL